MSLLHIKLKFKTIFMSKIKIIIYYVYNMLETAGLFEY